MGCEFSRICIGYCSFCSQSGRKRLSSGDSCDRQDVDSQEYDEKADDKFRNGDDRDAKESNKLGAKVNRIRNMFTRRTAKTQLKPDKLGPPTNSSEHDYSTKTSLQETVESAVRNRNAEQLLRLMQQSGDEFDLLPATNVPKKFNPIELACSLGYYDIVDVFLDNGCSPNLPTSAGKLLHTVLDSLKSHEESIESGRLVVKRLISSGCDLDIKDRCGITPLVHCAQIGDSQIMRAVLDRCSDKQLTCRCSGSLYTPLHMSAMRGDFECVRMLIIHSPHKHVNEKDGGSNTALHLALKSMLHNISYLNAARHSLMSCSKTQSVQRRATCEHLMSFQQNSIAIVEALVMAGADVHAVCSRHVPTESDQEYYPLIYALRLCAEDSTLGFELDPDQFSNTLNLVSRRTIQSLEDLGKAAGPGLPERGEDSKSKHTFSPYAGVVRLLVLAGTVMTKQMQIKLYDMFGCLHPLLDEICAFWDRYEVSKPHSLVHLAKLNVRARLAEVHRLHEINRLPLPPRMKEYLKLNYL